MASGVGGEIPGCLPFCICPCKWRVDGRLIWEHYQEAVKEEFVENSEGWWSDEVERIIDVRKVACMKLHRARKREEEEGMLKQLWDKYRRVRMRVKRKIRKEKELRKNSEED